MEHNYDELLEKAKKHLAENNPDPEPGPSTEHVSRIHELLEEYKGDDVIMHSDIHNNFIISRTEKYACVTGNDLDYHYLFSDNFKEYELIPR